MTSDTPTPRTDAVYEQNKAHWSADMMTPFARQLERELSAAETRVAELERELAQLKKKDTDSYEPVFRFFRDE